jgi:hypothetical protein
VWIRKNAAEITAADRQHRLTRLNPTRAIILALWCAGIGLVLSRSGCGITRSWCGEPASLFAAAHVYAKAFAACFAVIYVLRACLPESLRPDNAGFCPDCHFQFFRYKKNAPCHAAAHSLSRCGIGDLR